MTLEQEIEIFDNYLEELSNTFRKKRADYGPTTTETFEKFGPVSMLIRMHDKLGRLDNLLGNNQTAKVYESIEDTLMDLANYCVITLLELRKAEMECRNNATRDTLNGLCN